MPGPIFLGINIYSLSFGISTISSPMPAFLSAPRMQTLAVVECKLRVHSAQSWLLDNQSRPQRPRSFWSAPGIETSELSLKPAKKPATPDWLLKTCSYLSKSINQSGTKNSSFRFLIAQSRCVFPPLVKGTQALGTRLVDNQ